MRLVKVLSALLGAVLAVGMVAAASASAHEFEASKAPGLLTIKQHGLQVFTVPTGTVNCENLKGHGLVSTVKTDHQKITVSYSSCTSAVGTITEPINTSYELLASGLVSVLEQFKIEATAAGVKCRVTVLPQSRLESAKYDTLSNSSILLLGGLSGVETSATGAGCSNPYACNLTGKFTGNVLIALVGGTIIWK